MEQQIVSMVDQPKVVVKQKTRSKKLEGEYIEKVVCSDCGQVSYRELEKQELILDETLKDKKVLYAVFVKEHKCKKCQSTKFSSFILDREAYLKEVK